MIVGNEVIKFRVVIKHRAFFSFVSNSKITVHIKYSSFVWTNYIILVWSSHKYIKTLFNHSFIICRVFKSYNNELVKTTLINVRFSVVCPKILSISKYFILSEGRLLNFTQVIILFGQVRLIILSELYYFSRLLCN